MIPTAEVAEGLISALLSTSPAQEHLEMAALLAERPRDDTLGMTPGVLSWWAGQAGPSQAWEREAAEERAAYSKSVLSRLRVPRQGVGVLLKKCSLEMGMDDLLSASHCQVRGKGAF